MRKLHIGLCSLANLKFITFFIVFTVTTVFVYLAVWNFNKNEVTFRAVYWSGKRKLKTWDWTPDSMSKVTSNVKVFHEVASGQVFEGPLNFSTDPNNKDVALFSFLLNVRKLNVFAVHELNKRGNEEFGFGACAKWWANPLRTLKSRVTTDANGYVIHSFAFQAEPGKAQFSVEIFQRKPPVTVDEDELQIVGPFVRLDKMFEKCPVKWLEEHENNIERMFCPCDIFVPHPQELSGLAALSDSIVGTAGANMGTEVPFVERDALLPTWPVNRSTVVGDYLTFTQKTALINPGEKLPKKQLSYCGPEVKILVMVSSAPSHFGHRKTIRETYGSEDNLRPIPSRLVFLFGKVNDVELQKSLTEEAKQFDDIIQEDFLDGYHNLTLSHLSMYKWIQLTCSTKGYFVPKFILKADDDFFLNVPLALRLAEANSDTELLGCLFCGSRPVRDIAYMTKYYVPHYMVMSEWYPGYLSGVAYVLRGDIIPRFLHMSLSTPIIHMDDAYITGLLPRNLLVYAQDSKLFTYGRIEPHACDTKTMVSSFALSLEDMRLQWEAYKAEIPPDCSLPQQANLTRTVLPEATKMACFYN